VAKGTFREDLFYRINVVRIDLPSLRERREDIPLLVSEFVKEFCVQEGKVLAVSEKAMQTLCTYHWPGNVRQLRNVVERAVVLSRREEILPSDLPAEVCAPSGGSENAAPSAVVPLREMEAEAIRRALVECAGNKSLVAKKLGFSRKALYRRLKDYDLS
jgi:two-component system response regulator HydG